ncbi:MAG: DUF5103 domain-containing protein [Bacteroidales bacterium]|nr:DUF5103 domain-containing protein [Bacteroidales bacterium]
MAKIILTLMAFSYVLVVKSQEDFYDNTSIRYSDYIYKETIHTPMIHKYGNELTYPFIELNSADTLMVQFDDFETSVQDYYFTIIHCDKNWNPSRLLFNEYAEGLMDIPIRNFQFSFNTFQSYIHYEFTIPNEYIKLKLSGNYLLIVHENDHQKPILSLRFFVYEPLVQVQATAKQATISEYMKTHHEIDFSLTCHFNCNNPFSEINVVISQNFRYDLIIDQLKPQFVKENELVYNYEQENLFPAGNEFRWVDAKSIKFQTENVQKIEYIKPLYHYFLYPDEKRTFKRYFQWQDINGKFLIKNDFAKNSKIEADYVWVHFFLPWDAPLIDGNMYVAGNFNRWQYNSTNMMRYNYQKKGYELSLLLKQGYYDYAYAFLRDGEKSADFSLVEGNHFETENDYYIFVYWKPNTGYYDRLVAIYAVNNQRHKK